MINKAKVLTVDDEQAIVEIITSMFSPCSYDMKPAYGDREAVSIAKEFHPDCVVTGYMMPGMDGLEGAAAILRSDPECKFAFVTASSDRPEVREACERFGLDMRLLSPKPCTRTEVLHALARTGFLCSGA